MSTLRAPKQWSLTKNETITSFESWRQNLTYSLSLDPGFAPFLVTGTTWTKKTNTTPLRGLVDDPEGTPNRRNAAQKVAQLDLMLGQIANFCPIISRNTITKNSTSIDNIWQSIRAHFGFQSTGAHFIDLMNIQLKVDERPEDLYQRIMAFVEDSLLTTTAGLSHHGEVPTEDEELTPTLENLVVLFWLHLVHKDLPALVKQRYGTELRSRTLASIKPEISQAMNTLLDSLQQSEEAKVMRAGAFPSHHLKQTTNSRFNRQANRHPTCPICQASGKTSTSHYLSKCPYLPDSDRRFLARARAISALDEPDQEQEFDDRDSGLTHQASSISIATPPSTRRVQINKPPTIDMHYKHHTINLTLDSGAEANMIKESSAKRIGAHITPSTQTAIQADGKTSLDVKGEIKLLLTRGGLSFTLEALVVEDIDSEVLAGVPFMISNDISLRPAKSEIRFIDDSVYTYKNNIPRNTPNSIRLISSHVLRAPETTVWPGEFIELEVPSEFSNSDIALEPRVNKHSESENSFWPQPMITRAIAGKVRIPNLTDLPKVLKKNEHFAQTIPVSTPPTTQLPPTTDVHEPASDYPIHSITVDQDDQLPNHYKSEFENLHHQYKTVFNTSFKGYNGAFGPLTAVVNMGKVEPPQRKGRVPQYSRDKLVELQQKFDELESLGVFSKPEDDNIVAEYLNPSFLVKKPSGGHRLVTSFGEVARYSKPQPALMPDINNTLRTIGQWKYLIKTDLAQAFFQIPLSTDSKKYCGVATPFKGIRVYNRCAMGMPGSETALEELLSRVLGDLIQEGVVAKIADDLYCGGATPSELLHNWEQVLINLQKSDLALSARKTVIAPRSTTVLGWIWSEGNLTASPHRIATLSTCNRPTTVKALRSFLGAYKYLSRVIPNCSSFLSPLETLVAGKQSHQDLIWSESTTEAFEAAQKHLHNNKSITIPKPRDQLWLVTDGAVKKPGIGSTLYIQRDGQLHVSGYFSAKLRQRQTDWIPCETEALSIAASLQHFSPYIIQSIEKPSVLTDSKPCVQAHNKLLKGQFSNSSRLSTFLSTACRYAVKMQHLDGSANVPSDFQSRNAPECHDPSCQICLFVNDLETATVNAVSTESIIKGTSRMPFITRSTWLSSQSECPDLRRVHSHLRQGTRPSKKLTNVKDIKRYLNCCTLSKDGMIVVPLQQPFSPVSERIVVPRSILAGLLTALHIRLDHPTQFQLKKVFCRYFYALDLDNALQQVNANCHTCVSLQKLPSSNPPETTSEPPPVIGHSFAADVLRLNKQFILILRETVTSFTSACLIESEEHSALRDGLINLSINLRPLDGPTSIVRVDPAPGFTKLFQDAILLDQHIMLDIGRIKNVNKNPVAEKAVRELEDELLRLNDRNQTLTPTSLSVAVARLNTRIRYHGLSSRELWTQRDQFTHQQIHLDDYNLIQEQHHRRFTNNQYTNQRTTSQTQSFDIGTLVYLKNEKSKSSKRSRYLITQCNHPWYQIRKFVSDQLRNATYKVHQSELCSVPSTAPPSPSQPPATDEPDDTLVPDLQPSDIIGEVSPSITSPPTPADSPAEETPPPILSTVEPTTTDVTTQRPTRERRPPTYLRDYVTD